MSANNKKFDYWCKHDPKFGEWVNIIVNPETMSTVDNRGGPAWFRSKDKVCQELKGIES